MSSSFEPNQPAYEPRMGSGEHSAAAEDGSTLWSDMIFGIARLRRTTPVKCSRLVERHHDIV